MKIVQINTSCGIGSTGKICFEIGTLLNSRNIENYVLYSVFGNGAGNSIACANKEYIKHQALKSKIFGNYGFNSNRATKKIIRELEIINPDIVHLHNIHGHDCNLETLFTYFKNNKTKLYWTFHDCWAFTGYCPHFTMVKCDKWKTECHNCPQRKCYSWLFDKSRELFNKKKQLFSDLDLTIVTPSQWLADLVKESFLKDYPVKVINNGIDLDLFHPVESNFREKYGIPSSKKIVLGVAFDWGVRKGLDVFVELSKRLDADTYQIVLVGTNDHIDQQLPKNIISIHRTQNQKELAEIYTAADLFVIPTREENFPTVNIESLACGTPVLTFETGGSPEIIDETCGAVVPCDDVDALAREIVRICVESPYDEESCVIRSKDFDKSIKFEEYLNLYKDM